MIGLHPKFRTYDRTARMGVPGADRQVRVGDGNVRLATRRCIAITALLPLSFVLTECGNAPTAGMLAANSRASLGDSFDDRFPATQFTDRFPTTSESFEQRHPPDPPDRAGAQAEQPARYQVASLPPTVPYQRPSRGDHTELVGLKSSAFPYFGNSPRTDEPFLNISRSGRHGHRSYGGKVYWQDETYNDSRVLMHVPESFDVSKPGVIVVFFHGNGATLQRDVRERQLVPQQISDSGVNAVLLAPQLAVDAADSSAGKFWQPGGLKRFITESAPHLARLYGDPAAAKAFAKMPIILVGYSGGYMPTAWCLEVGGLGDRIRGVVLLDAVYGELDKFASWIANNRSGFFVSAYTHHTRQHDRELMQLIREKGIAISGEIDGPPRPGSVVFVETPDGVSHRDYVTQAWTEKPVQDVLVKVAGTLAATRIASSPASSAGR